MRKINNIQELDLEIYKLSQEIKAKENQLANQFEKLSADFEPGALINTGFKAMFKTNMVNKTLVSTVASLGVGFLIERVILRKSNLLVKYGIAQIAMSLVSQLAAENWQPEFMLQLKEALAKVIRQEQTESSSPAPAPESDSKDTI